MADRQGQPELLNFTDGVTSGGSGAILSRESQDLDLNLVRFADGAGVGAHRNSEVDVLLIVVAGRGVVEVDGEAFDLEAGNGLLIPKGTERSIRSMRETQFVYLTVHQRRRGLMPSPRRATSS